MVNLSKNFSQMPQMFPVTISCSRFQPCVIPTENCGRPTHFLFKKVTFLIRYWSWSCNAPFQLTSLPFKQFFPAAMATDINMTWKHMLLVWFHREKCLALLWFWPAVICVTKLLSVYKEKVNTGRWLIMKLWTVLVGECKQGVNCQQMKVVGMMSSATYV